MNCSALIQQPIKPLLTSNNKNLELALSLLFSVILDRAEQGVSGWNATGGDGTGWNGTGWDGTSCDKSGRDGTGDKYSKVWNPNLYG